MERKAATDGVMGRRRKEREEIIRRPTFNHQHSDGGSAVSRPLKKRITGAARALLFTHRERLHSLRGAPFFPKRKPDAAASRGTILHHTFPSQMNWFYESGGQQQGPVSESELDRLIAEGRITMATLVWKEGMNDWRPLREVRPAVGGAPAAGGLMAPPIPVSVAKDGIACASCGRAFPASEVIQIGDRPICPDCKPAVLQNLQQGAGLPSGFGSQRTGPPWEEREALGTWTAAWETIKGVLTQPTETFARMKREGGLAKPLWFNVIFGSIGSIMGVVYQFAASALGLVAEGQNEANPLAPFLTSAIGLTAMCVLMPLFIALGSFIYAGVLHVSLMICGGAKQPFEATLRVSSYTSGAAGILQVIPVCGALVSGVWWIVVACIGVAQTHEINTGRAVLAVLLPIIVCCGLMVALIFTAVGIGAAAGGFQPPVVP